MDDVLLTMHLSMHNQQTRFSHDSQVMSVREERRMLYSDLFIDGSAGTTTHGV